ncbi:helix-turn-helix domain-containing protein [Streptomyces niveus]|uniref:helix-turn-helix domain-containing protein n=1 Tax=Streptomyces niveus TaxID=193462 RepID=UPI00362F9898
MRTESRSTRELALWLRSQRQRSGMTYAQLAAQTGFSASSLSRAASGERLPSSTVVEAFAQGCGGDPRKAAALWRRARYTAYKKAADDEGTVAMLPDYIRNFAQLHAAALELYRRAGSPPLRQLEATGVGRYGGLPRSSVSRLLRGQAIPSKDLLIAFVRACSVTDGVETGVWEGAWERANQAAVYERALRRGVSSGDLGEQLRSNLRIAEQRLKELTGARAVHVKQRAEILAEYRAFADSRPRPARDGRSILDASLENDANVSRRRELLQQLTAADSATSTVQREIDEIAERLAVLRERLTAEGAVDATPVRSRRSK